MNSASIPYSSFTFVCFCFLVSENYLQVALLSSITGQATLSSTEISIVEPTCLQFQYQLTSTFVTLKVVAMNVGLDTAVVLRRRRAVVSLVVESRGDTAELDEKNPVCCREDRSNQRSRVCSYKEHVLRTWRVHGSRLVRFSCVEFCTNKISYM